MSDPKRLTEADQGGEAERDLLLAGQAARLPERERRALWASIASSLPSVAPPPNATEGPLAGTAGSGALLTKGLIFLAAVTGFSLAASPFLRSVPAETRAAPSLASVVVPASPRPSPVQPATVATSEPSLAAAEKPPGDGRARPATNSQLREESVAVLEARAALRGGDAARSLTLLEQARARFPRGALGQEREALTIQALARSGDAASARRRAAAFLHAYPHSPYVADVQRLANP